MRLIQFQASAAVQLCTLLLGLSAVLAKGLTLPVVDIVAGRALWATVTLAMILFILRHSQWTRLSWRDGFHLSVNGVLLGGTGSVFLLVSIKEVLPLVPLGLPVFPYSSRFSDGYFSVALFLVVV